MIKLILFKNGSLWNEYVGNISSAKVYKKETFLDANANGIEELVDIKEVSSFRTVVLEQPEIGLHPIHHRKCIEFVCNIARKLPEVTFIVASHSKTTLNLLGDFIEDGLYPELTKELTIEILTEDGVSESRFDEEGDLVDWQIGFMSGR